MQHSDSPVNILQNARGQAGHLDLALGLYKNHSVEVLFGEKTILALKRQAQIPTQP